MWGYVQSPGGVPGRKGENSCRLRGRIRLEGLSVGHATLEVQATGYVTGVVPVGDLRADETIAKPRFSLYSQSFCQCCWACWVWSSTVAYSRRISDRS